MKKNKIDYNIVITAIISLCIVSLLTGTINEACYGLEKEESVKSVNSINEIDTEDLKNVDAVNVKYAAASDADSIEELVQNGVNVLIEGDDAVEVAELIDDSFEINESDECKTLGVFIENGNQRITATEIVGVVFDSDTGEVDKDETSNLIGSEILDVNEVVSDIHLKNSEAPTVTSTEAEEDTIAHLQSFAPNFFKDASKFAYFYKKKGATSTDYKWSKEESLSGYEKIGSAKITAFAVAVKKSKKKQTEWDDVYSVCTVSAFGSKRVKSYKYKMRVPDTGNHVILDETFLNDGKSVSTEIGSAVGTDGVSITANESYSYTTKSQDITNQLGYQYSKIWSSSANYKNEDSSYKMKPSILVKHLKADKYNTTVYCTLDKLKLAGSVRDYTMDTNLTLTFKFSRFL